MIAWPPDAARELGAERRYLPRNVPLVKRIAAAQGDRVCAVGEAVYVNGRPAARRSLEDAGRRPMPWWMGCEELGSGELLLLAAQSPDSFDGRYFGITRPRHVVGRAKLIWRR